MATSVLGVSHDHYRSVTVTSLASLAGIAAGLAADVLAAGPTDTLGVAVFVGFTAVQYPLLSVLGIDVQDFSKKDHLYVVFMTFALWFVTYALILTAETPT